MPLVAASAAASAAASGCGERLRRRPPLTRRARLDRLRELVLLGGVGRVHLKVAVPAQLTDEALAYDVGGRQQLARHSQTQRASSPFSETVDGAKAERESPLLGTCLS